jgi:mediator of RNA polymerase II transcription subunit 10
MVQVHSYDTSSKPSDEVLHHTADLISDHLIRLHSTVTPPPPPSSSSDSHNPAHSSGNPRKVTLPDVPPELIAYVDGGRNPDIYTREFVEVARRNNQLMKGKMDAFAGFRDLLAGEIERGLPELKDDVRKVVEATGGKGSADV